MDAIFDSLLTELNLQEHLKKMIEKMNTLNGFRATLAENMKYLNGLE